MEPGGQRNLADAFARAELAAQEQLAHLQEGAQGLGFVTPGSRHWSSSPYHGDIGLVRVRLHAIVCMQRMTCLLSEASARPWHSGRNALKLAPGQVCTDWIACIHPA